MSECRKTHRPAFRSAALFGLVGVFASFVPCAQAALNIGVSSTNYMGIGESGRQDSYSALDFELNAKTESDEIDSRALVQSQIGFNDSTYRFVEFPELYLATSRKWSPNAQTTLGRRLQNWSSVDETWGTGAFQPQFRWDYLRPQQVGLLGLYQDFRSGPVRVTVFASPLYIPDRGAPLDFSDGRIRSVSPWVVNPPYEIEIQKQQVPVRYEARVPSVAEVVRQNSIAGQVFVGEKYGPWVSSSYAYKPMNQLLIGYEADIALAKATEANVVLYPRVAYHHLAALDTGYRTPTISGTLSFLADLPVDEAQPLSRTSQQVGNMYLVSPTLRMTPFGKQANGFTLSYLRVIGKDRPDTGVLSDGESSEFDSRYPFKNAFMLSAELPTWRRLTTELKLLADLENPGTIVSSHFTYAADRDWRLFLATDVLSSFSDDGDGTNFIRRYRQNDRVTGGVTYVF
jgi:hypothetical protein